MECEAENRGGRSWKKCLGQGGVKIFLRDMVAFGTGLLTGKWDIGDKRTTNKDHDCGQGREVGAWGVLCCDRGGRDIGGMRRRYP